MNWSAEFTLNDWRGFGHISRKEDVTTGKIGYLVQLGDKGAAWELTPQQYWMLRHLVELMEVYVKEHNEQRHP